MMEKIYINAVSMIAPGTPEPDYKAFISPIEARRMGKMMKRAIATSRTALATAGIEHPDAIITGTFLGSVENTEALLMSLTGVNDNPLKPTHFMQSTHNTVSSLIGIQTKSHGYNATYSHGALSFESAILDAVTQLKLGVVENVLVCLADETSPTFDMMLKKVGEKTMDISTAMVLSHNQEGALCELADFRMSHGGAAMEAARGIDADAVAWAPLGYADAAARLSEGAASSLLVINGGKEGDNTSYALLKKI